MYGKLDLAIFREDCRQIFPNYLVMNGSFTYSDHFYVSFNTDPTHCNARKMLMT